MNYAITITMTSAAGEERSHLRYRVKVPVWVTGLIIQLISRHPSSPVTRGRPRLTAPTSTPEVYGSN